MTGDSVPEILGVADIEVTLRILENKPKTFEMAPAVGFEPTTNRLTADRSTTELRWITFLAERRAYSLPRESRAASRFQICKIDLVAGAGFEPAVRQLPDYELSRCKPVIVKKHFPRPCPFGRFSNFLASVSDISSVCQAIAHRPRPCGERDWTVFCLSTVHPAP